MNYDQKSKSQPTSRLDWVDYARGIAIILVVYGHVLIGAYNSKLDISYSFYNYSLKFMYSFHMPVFFFLAGMFVTRSISKSPTKFLMNKLKTIAYPYLIWSIIQGSVYSLMSPFTNFKFNIVDLPFAIAFSPQLQFWFLYVLLVYHVLFAVFTRFCSKNFYYVMVPLSLLTYFLSYYTDVDIVHKILKFFIFYVLGAVCVKALTEQKKLPSSGIQVLILALVFTVAQNILIDFSGPFHIVGDPATSLFLAILGIAFILCFSMYISQYKNADFLRYLGTVSMPIYLIHILAAVATRIVLQKMFRIDNAILHISLGTLVGLLLPMGLNLWIQKIKFNYLFSFK